jgi:single-stranded DNA-binding protein
MNRCIIEGEINRDPEVRLIKNEFKLLTLNVSVPRKKDGFDYFRCNLWRGLADKYEGKFSKGQKVHVSGSVSASAYIGKDEKPRASLELTVEEIGGIPTQQGFVEIDNDPDLPF